MMIVTNGKKYMVAMLAAFSEEEFETLEEAKEEMRFGLWSSIELDNTWAEVEGE